MIKVLVLAVIFSCIVPFLPKVSADGNSVDLPKFEEPGLRLANISSKNAQKFDSLKLQQIASEVRQTKFVKLRKRKSKKSKPNSQKSVDEIEITQTPQIGEPENQTTRFTRMTVSSEVNEIPNSQEKPSSLQKPSIVILPPHQTTPPPRPKQFNNAHLSPEEYNFVDPGFLNLEENRNSLENWNALDIPIQPDQFLDDAADFSDFPPNLPAEDNANSAYFEEGSHAAEAQPLAAPPTVRTKKHVKVIYVNGLDDHDHDLGLSQGHGHAYDNPHDLPYPHLHELSHLPPYPQRKSKILYVIDRTPNHPHFPADSPRHPFLFSRYPRHQIPLGYAYPRPAKYPPPPADSGYFYPKPRPTPPTILYLPAPLSNTYLPAKPNITTTTEGPTTTIDEGEDQINPGDRPDTTTTTTTTTMATTTTTETEKSILPGGYEDTTTTVSPCLAYLPPEATTKAGSKTGSKTTTPTTALLPPGCGTTQIPDTVTIETEISILPGGYNGTEPEPPPSTKYLPQPPPVVHQQYGWSPGPVQYHTSFTSAEFPPFSPPGGGSRGGYSPVPAPPSGGYSVFPPPPSSDEYLPFLQSPPAAAAYLPFQTPHSSEYLPLAPPHPIVQHHHYYGKPYDKEAEDNDEDDASEEEDDDEFENSPWRSPQRKKNLRPHHPRKIPSIWHNDDWADEEFDSPPNSNPYQHQQTYFGSPRYRRQRNKAIEPSGGGSARPRQRNNRKRPPLESKFKPRYRPRFESPRASDQDYEPNELQEYDRDAVDESDRDRDRDRDRDGDREHNEEQQEFHDELEQDGEPRQNFRERDIDDNNEQLYREPVKESGHRQYSKEQFRDSDLRDYESGGHKFIREDVLTSKEVVKVGPPRHQPFHTAHVPDSDYPKHESEYVPRDSPRSTRPEPNRLTDFEPYDPKYYNQPSSFRSNSERDDFAPENNKYRQHSSTEQSTNHPKFNSKQIGQSPPPTKTIVTNYLHSIFDDERANPFVYNNGNILDPSPSLWNDELNIPWK